jgi:predicted nucleic acid-binding protein
MKTAVDSSVLLDVLAGDRAFGARSREALRAAYDGGTIVACDIVWAEVRAHYPDDAAFGRALDALGVVFEPLTADAAGLAGALWRDQRRAAQAGRERIVADFLIGAHATLQADVLLTRDRGFYRRYFKVRIIDPADRTSA